MPERLGAQYVAEDGGRRVPVMLHRAILGSLERFIGILIEEHAGIMPLWLSPVQVAVLCITDAHAEYAREVEAALKGAGIRAVADLRNEKIGLKIREHTLSRVPYLAIVGAGRWRTGAWPCGRAPGRTRGPCPSPRSPSASSRKWGGAPAGRYRHQGRNHLRRISTSR